MQSIKPQSDKRTVKRLNKEKDSREASKIRDSNQSKQKPQKKKKITKGQFPNRKIENQFDFIEHER